MPRARETGPRAAVERLLERSKGGRGLSVRLRIVLVALLPLLAFLPVVVLTSHVLKVVLERTDEIMLHDLQVETVLDALARDVLVARSEIKSFILDGSAQHFERNRAITGECPRHVAKLETLLGKGRDDVRQLDALVREYAWRSDSLVALAVRVSARDVGGSLHFRRLDEIADEMVATMDVMLAGNSERIESNRRRLSIWALRARRDVITALILTILVEIVLIALLPRLLLRPLKRLQRTLQQATQGRLEARAETGPGEFGSLGLAINRVLEAFQKSDALARNKIVEVSNRFRLVASTLECGVLVLDADLVPIYANPWILERRGWSEAELAGATLDTLFESEGLAHQLTTLMLRPEEDSIEVRMRAPQGALPQVLQCRIVLDRSGELANLVTFVRDSSAIAAATNLRSS